MTITHAVSSFRFSNLKEGDVFQDTASLKPRMHYMKIKPSRNPVVNAVRLEDGELYTFAPSTTVCVFDVELTVMVRNRPKNP